MIVESKLKSGVLTLGGTDTGGVITGGQEFACQATNVRLSPSFNDSGDELETLCGDKLAPDTKTTWSLQGTSVQDFDNPDGLIKFAFDNNLMNVPFSWQPNAGDMKWTGTVQMRALETGGDVNSRLTTDFDWPVQGDPVPTWPAAEAVEAAVTEDYDQGEPVDSGV